MRTVLALALATTALSTAFAENLPSNDRRIDIERRLDEYEHRTGEFEHRLDEFRQFGKPDDPRLADTKARYEDMQSREADYRKQWGQPPAGRVASPTSCAKPSEAEKQAFRSAAVLDGGITEAQSWGLDFSCEEGQGSPVVAGSGAPPQDKPELSEASVGPSGASSPVGDYKLTWQSDGQGWTTLDKGYPSSGHTGYGNVWDNGKNVDHENGVTTLSLTKCSEGGKQHCGAEITTRGVKEFTHGYAELEAKATDGRGQFPAALWMMGDGQWPASGEIDVHEAVKNGRDNDKVFFSAHWAGCGGKCQITDPNTATVANMDGWNRYGVRRSPDKIEQIINGKVTGTITRAEAAAKGGNYSVIFDAPMHLRADIGADDRPGQWAAHDSGQIDPGNVQIRNVKVYE